MGSNEIGNWVQEVLVKLVLRTTQSGILIDKLLSLSLMKILRRLEHRLYFHARTKVCGMVGCILYILKSSRADQGARASLHRVNFQGH